MIKFDEWYFPDGETHIPEWMTTVDHRVEGRLTYQYQKYQAALKHCEEQRVAIDVGAHVGLWSYWMRRDFTELAAFEPVRAHRDCWNLNMMGRRGRTRLFPCALGDKPGYTSVCITSGNSGDSHIGQGGAERVPVQTLDSFHFRYVDFLKIDCEGYELAVLKGARELLDAWEPVVLVEQKAGHGTRYGVDDRAAIDFLTTEFGYRLVEMISGDALMAPA